MTETPTDPVALREELIADLYDALRSVAGRSLDRGSRLDPTDLVHHAWVRLSREDDFVQLPRAEFLALCAKVMRRIAGEEGRRRRSERRDLERMTLTTDAEGAGSAEVDVLALEDALSRLEQVDRRWARVVELRFFGGLSVEEVAGVMGLSRRTVTNEWTLARAWLKRKLG